MVMHAGRLASFGPAASPDSGLRLPPEAHKGLPPSAEGQGERLATARSHAGRPTSFAGCTPFGVRRGRLKRNGTAPAFVGAVFLWLWMLGVWRASGLLRRPTLASVFLREPTRCCLRQPKARARWTNKRGLDFGYHHFASRTLPGSYSRSLGSPGMRSFSHALVWRLERK